jgi:hypothetical protein
MAQMVATTADRSIDSPARQVVRYSSLDTPIDLSAFSTKAHLRTALAASGEGA